MSKNEIYEYIKTLVNKSNFLKSELDKIRNNIYSLRENHPEKDDVIDDFEATIDILWNKILKIDSKINEIEVTLGTKLNIDEIEILQTLFEKLEYLEARLEKIESELSHLEDELIDYLEE